MREVAFLHDFLIEQNEGLNLRVCHFAGSACLRPSRPPIFASKPLPQEEGGREGAFPPPKVAPVRDIGFFTTFSKVKSIELYMDLQVQIAFFITFSGVKPIELYVDLQVQNVVFFTTFSGVKSIELYMDLQVQNVVFFITFSRVKSIFFKGFIWIYKCKM